MIRIDSHWILINSTLMRSDASLMPVGSMSMAVDAAQIFIDAAQIFIDATQIFIDSTWILIVSMLILIDSTQSAEFPATGSAQKAGGTHLLSIETGLTCVGAVLMSFEPVEKPMDVLAHFPFCTTDAVRRLIVQFVARKIVSWLFAFW